MGVPPFQRVLDGTQRYWQYRIGVQFEDAEPARKFDERRVLVGSDRKRKRGSVFGLAAAVVGEAARQHHLEARLLGKRARKTRAFDALRVRRELGLDDRSAALGLEADRLCALARHRRVELEGHGANREAVRVTIHALARELDGEVLPHLERKALRYTSLEPGARLHLLADHDPHPGGRWQPLRAAHAEDGQFPPALVFDAEERQRHRSAVLQVHAV